MHYAHNSHKARNAQAQFIERFLPSGGAVADVDERRDGERCRCGYSELSANVQVL